MNVNKNLKFLLLKMKKTGDTIVWLSTIDMFHDMFLKMVSFTLQHVGVRLMGI